MNNLVRLLNTIGHFAILVFATILLGLLEYGAARRGVLEMVHHHRGPAALMYVAAFAIFLGIIALWKLVIEKVLKPIWFDRSEDFSSSALSI